MRSWALGMVFVAAGAPRSGRRPRPRSGADRARQRRVARSADHDPVECGRRSGRTHRKLLVASQHELDVRHGHRVRLQQLRSGRPAPDEGASQRTRQRHVFLAGQSVPGPGERRLLRLHLVGAAQLCGDGARPGSGGGAHGHCAGLRRVVPSLRVFRHHLDRGDRRPVLHPRGATKTPASPTRSTWARPGSSARSSTPGGATSLPSTIACAPSPPTTSGLSLRDTDGARHERGPGPAARRRRSLRSAERPSPFRSSSTGPTRPIPRSTATTSTSTTSRTSRATSES